MILAGVLAFVLVDVALLVAMHGRPPLSVAVVVGVGVAAGALVLIARPDRATRGLGVGLLVGWALVTLFSDGILTGLG